MCGLGVVQRCSTQFVTTFLVILPLSAVTTQVKEKMKDKEFVGGINCWGYLASCCCQQPV
jgi:hypothetical protein